MQHGVVSAFRQLIDG